MKQPKKNPWRSWNSILIDGTYLPRIVVSEEGKCTKCGRRKGNFHVLSCEKNESPCGKHEFLVECNCNIRLGEEV